MAMITYLDFAGRATTVDVPNAWSLMQGAVSKYMEGIVGECCGSMACATCHCDVEEARLPELPSAGDGELGMLDLAATELRPTSRLFCQIKASPGLDGLVVHMPETQG